MQTPEDVDKLRDIGVKTIFCLQQDSDLEYPLLYFPYIFKSNKFGCCGQVKSLNQYYSGILGLMLMLFVNMLIHVMTLNMFEPQ